MRAGAKALSQLYYGIAATDMAAYWDTPPGAHGSLPRDPADIPTYVGSGSAPARAARPGAPRPPRAPPCPTAPRSAGLPAPQPLPTSLHPRLLTSRRRWAAKWAALTGCSVIAEAGRE